MRRLRNRRVTPVAYVNRKLYHLSIRGGEESGVEEKEGGRVPTLHVVGDGKKRKERKKVQSTENQ
jgi:hypothetical protein